MAQIAWSFFLYGVIFGSTSCLASCGPLVVTYIAGTKKGLWAGLREYFLFSLARVSAYLFLSVLIFFAGSLMFQQRIAGLSRSVYLAGGAFVILVGIALCLGKQLECWPRPWGWLKKHISGSGAKSILLLGLIIGFLPCAPLIAIFSSVGLTARSWLASLVYGLSFGIGTVISPLLLLAPAAGFIPQLLKPAKAAYRYVFNCLCGLIIIVLGLQLARKGF